MDAYTISIVVSFVDYPDRQPVKDAIVGYIPPEEIDAMFKANVWTMRARDLSAYLFSIGTPIDELPGLIGAILWRRMQFFDDGLSHQKHGRIHHLDDYQLYAVFRTSISQGRDSLVCSFRRNRCNVRYGSRDNTCR